MPEPLVYLNGSLFRVEDAKVSVFDHGLVVGDGVFETVLLDKGHPFALTRHLERIERSAKGLGIQVPDREELQNAVERVVATAEFELGRIRITITAGRGPLASGRLDGPPTVVVACSAAELHDDVGSLAVVPWTRNENGALAGLKTTSYAENALALAYAAERGADEAIFANTAGMLCEGTGSNVFAVYGGELITPTLRSGCLAGVTRALVLERIGGEERDLPVGALQDDELTEVFLTSTIRGIEPIGQVDGRRLPAAPGEVTAAAISTYEQILEEIDP